MMSRDTPKQNLYRIASFDRAVEIIRGRKLYFAHPSTWDDPYENLLQHKDSSAIFAQCWSRKALSDAMWRIYSSNGLGVRIGTTRERLHKALTSAKNRQGLRFKIKNVEYLYKEELDDRLSRIKITLDQGNHSPAYASAPLFLKRSAYDHEQESRVIIYDKTHLTSSGTKGITIDVEPFEVISSIWIDPRAPESFVEAYTYYLKEKWFYPVSTDT